MRGKALNTKQIARQAFLRHEEMHSLADYRGILSLHAYARLALASGDGVLLAHSRALLLPFVRGEEVLVHIRSTPELADVKVIVVTISSYEQTRLLREQAEYVFQKPYMLNEFRAAVSDLLKFDHAPNL